MKNINSDSAISEVMALLILVLVAVSMSMSYYTWIDKLQDDVQTTGSDITESRLDSFMSEIEIVCYPEYEYYNTDTNLDGEITVNATNATLDERFIQEIRVLIKNKAMFDLTNVKIKVISFGNGSLDWSAFHFDSSTGELFDREGVPYPFTVNESIYFTSANVSNTSMRFITDEGYSYFASNCSNGSVTINTTDLIDPTSLHNPTYEIGDIPKDEDGTGYVYLLVNRSSVPNDAALKLYITNDHGVDAYRTIQFKIR